jgi:hypothetical protein
MALLLGDFFILRVFIIYYHLFTFFNIYIHISTIGCHMLVVENMMTEMQYSKINCFYHNKVKRPQPDCGV